MTPPVVRKLLHLFVARFRRQNENEEERDQNDKNHKNRLEGPASGRRSRWLRIHEERRRNGVQQQDVHSLPFYKIDVETSAKSFASQYFDHRRRQRSPKIHFLSNLNYNHTIETL